MTLDTERRKDTRKRPPSLVYVELASANGGMMRDICEEGFAVRVMMPLRIGDSTPFAFSLDASTRFEGTCQVLWVEEEGHVAGMKFTDVSPQLLEQVRQWLAEEDSETDQPLPAPTHEVNTLEELRAELRGVKPRVEIPRPGTPAAEKISKEIPRVEAPRIEPPRVEPPRAETPRPEIARMETPGVEAPRIEPPQVERPRVETPRPLIARMEIPGVEEPTRKPRAEEEPVEHEEERIAPPPSREHEEITSRFPDEEEQLYAQPEISSFAERFSSAFEEVVAEPPAFQPLPELREPGLLDTRAPRLDSTTVSLAIRILIFLALIAAAVVFHRDLGNGLIWMGAKLSGSSTNTQTASGPEGPANPATLPLPKPSSAPPLVTPPADTAQNSLPTKEQKELNPSSSNADTKKSSNTPGATPSPSNPAAKPKSTSTTRSGPAANKPQKPAGEPESEPGEQEYLQAQEMLKSGDRDGGFQEAVRLLWIAVEKGNSRAEVSLAELYRRGEGVARNCDQTRILLTAAARKGNADAQRRLDKFLREGCE
ncbi:MAG TPA: PilZ domain-containing protein [Candidatus Acidoferrum sp.]|jgi:hypothetical protein